MLTSCTRVCRTSWATAPVGCVAISVLTDIIELFPLSSLSSDNTNCKNDIPAGSVYRQPASCGVFLMVILLILNCSTIVQYINYSISNAMLRLWYLDSSSVRTSCLSLGDSTRVCDPKCNRVWPPCSTIFCNN